MHVFFVFDTEYIPHYISWIERSLEMREIMKNTAVLPCKFHVRKHLSETLLARKPVLRNVLAELLTMVMVTSKKKCDEAFAASKRTSLTSMTMVRKLGAHETRKLYRGLGLTGNAPGNYKGLYDPIIDALGLRPDYEALYAQEKEKFTCKTDLSSARGVSVAFLRFMCEKNEIATVKEEEGDGGGGAVQVQIKRAELEVKLAAKLGLPMKRPRKQKEFNEKVKMNLHRLNQLLFYMLFRWDGEKWGGSSIRSEVIELCKAKYMNDDGGLSDEDAVKKAGAASSYFAGLWVFFDVEVRMCVEPFIDWEGATLRSSSRSSRSCARTCRRRTRPRFRRCS